MKRGRQAANAVRPRLDIPEGFVTQAENDVLAVALDVVAKVLARYEEAARAAGRNPGYAPSVALRVNPLGAAWAVLDISWSVEAHGYTLEHALRNLADQTDADRMRQKAQALRRQAGEIEDMAKEIDGDNHAGTQSRGDAEGRP